MRGDFSLHGTIIAAIKHVSSKFSAITLGPPGRMIAKAHLHDNAVKPRISASGQKSLPGVLASRKGSVVVSYQLSVVSGSWSGGASPGWPEVVLRSFGQSENAAGHETVLTNDWF